MQKVKKSRKRETFSAAVHLYNQYHFEDTPREAARVQTLAASLLLAQYLARSTAFQTCKLLIVTWMKAGARGSLIWEIGENLVKMSDLENLFDFRRKADDPHRASFFHHRHVIAHQFADAGTVEIIEAG